MQQNLLFIHGWRCKGGDSGGEYRYSVRIERYRSILRKHNLLKHDWSPKSNFPKTPHSPKHLYQQNSPIDKDISEESLPFRGTEIFGEMFFVF